VSTIDPGFRDAKIPKNIPKKLAINIENKVNSIVAGNLIIISLITFSLVTIDLPRSPFISCFKKIKYCIKIGLFKPSSSLIRASSPGVALSPKITLAGSPGINLINIKEIKETPIKIGIKRQ